MPRQTAPHATNAHRIACLSLYRALLRQCAILQRGHSDSPKHSKNRPVLTKLVNFRFSHDRFIQSPSAIVTGIKAGYATLDLVHACNNGSLAALSRLKTLLDSAISQSDYTSAYRNALSRARSPTSPQKIGKIAHIESIRQKSNFTRHPQSKHVLERPLPLCEIKGGKRRVPNLIVKQGLPFLRYSKPQPISLTRMIRQKGKQDMHMWDQKDGLQADKVIADWEDEWDDLVEAQVIQERAGAINGKDNWQWQYGSDKLVSSEETWGHEVKLADQLLTKKIRLKDWKNAEMGRKMWDIVVEERKLATRESRDAKIQRRLENKAATAAAIVAAEGGVASVPGSLAVPCETVVATQATPESLPRLILSY